MLTFLVATAITTMMSTLMVVRGQDEPSASISLVIKQDYTCADGTTVEDKCACQEYNTLCQFQPCLLKGNIKRQYMCDGVFDCQDLSDECLCDRVTSENKLTYNICAKLFHEIEVNDVCKKGMISCDPPGSKPEKPRCIKLSDVCDRKLDCPERWDEQYCRFPGQKNETKFISTYFFCNGSFVELDQESYEASGLVNDSWQYIDSRRMFDGVPDCDNIADEWHKNFVYCGDNGTELEISRCLSAEYQTFASPYNAVENIAFPCIEWCLGIFGVIGNTIVAVNSITYITRRRRRESNSVVDETNSSCRTLRRIERGGKINNHILVLFLCISDLILSIQIILMASANEYFRGIFWEHDETWLSSTQCAIVGCLAVFATQASAFMIVTISFVRLYVIAKPFNNVKVKTILIAGFSTYILAAIFMSIPLMTFIPPFERYFTNAVFVKNNPQVDATVLERDKIEDYVRKIILLSNESHECDISHSSWKDLEEIVSSINPEFGGWKYFGYYSQISICIPPIVAHWTDPGLLYSFLLLIIDFAAILLVVIAYYIVFRISRRGKKRTCIMAFRCCLSNNLKQRHESETAENVEIPTIRQRTRSMSPDEEDYEMQKRILWIIGTDCVCWTPICLLTLASVINENIQGDETLLFAMVAVQVNCVVNPLVYSRRVRRGIRHFASSCYKKVSKTFLYIFKRKSHRLEVITEDTRASSPTTRNTIPVCSINYTQSDRSIFNGNVDALSESSFSTTDV